MPDPFGFDHVGTPGAPVVACIEDGCHVRGPMHEWPDAARRKHHRSHGADRRSRAQEAEHARAVMAQAQLALTLDDEGGR